VEISGHDPVILAKARAKGVGTGPQQIVIDPDWSVFPDPSKIASSISRYAVMERKNIAGSVTLQAAGVALRTFRKPLTNVVVKLRRWHQLSNERVELVRLSDERLRDIGLSRADVVREASRPFWDDPLKR
jgi:uncharacterized protein YjiS (DUF1127 family)